MGYRFYHRDLISALVKEFPKLFKEKSKAELIFENVHKTRIGSGDDEKLVYEMEAGVTIDNERCNIRIPVKFIENATEELDIIVNEKLIYTVKKMGGISKELLKKLAYALEAYLG